MGTGLAHSLELLIASENLAALDLLFEVVRYGAPGPALEALDALLIRQHHDTLYRLVAQYHELPAPAQARLASEGSRLSTAIRRAYLEKDDVVYANACELIRRIPEYDEAPLLIAVLESDSPRKADAALLLDHLCTQLVGALEANAQAPSKPALEAIAMRFLDALRNGLRSYRKHRSEVVPRSFLRLARESTTEVLDIIADSKHPAHSIMVQLLRKETDRDVLRWIPALLMARYPPPVVLSIVAERCDPPFLEMLFDRVDQIADPRFAGTLRRLTEVRWLTGDLSLLRSFSEGHQSAALVFALNTGLPLEAKLALAAFLLDEGKPAARRTAACGLAQLQSADANRLILACLEDHDVEVQLAATQQLRNRGIPNALGLLLKQLEHPHEPIRQAARAALGDYNLERYLGVFEQMEDGQRRALGLTILKIDPNAMATLSREFRHPHRQQRLRAVRIARVLGVADQVADDLIDLLGDDDHMVRREAVESLSYATHAGPIASLAEIAGDVHDPRQPGAQMALEHLRRIAREAGVRAAAEAAYTQRKES